METVWEFVCAAAPWVAMGLVAAIVAVRGVRKQKRGDERDGDWGMESMSLGMGIGLLIGTALGDHIDLGISLGAPISLAVGMFIPKKGENGD